jgi:hypothetical protein
MQAKKADLMTLNWPFLIKIVQIKVYPSLPNAFVQ